MRLDDRTAASDPSQILAQGLARAWAAASAEPAEGPPGENGFSSPGSQRNWIEGILLASRPDAGLEVLRMSGALDRLIPEVAALIGLGEGEGKHKDLWEHTVKVVRQAESRPVLRWAALLHDVGKVRTRGVDLKGKVHFFGHAEIGAGICDRILRRFEMEGRMRRRVRFLVLFHHRASQYTPEWTDSAVRRFGREVGDAIEDLIALSKADMTTRRTEKLKRGLRHLEDLCHRLDTIQDEDSRLPPLPKGLGNDIMQRFGLPPGPHIGDLRRILELKVDAGEIEAFREADYYLDCLYRIGAVTVAAPAKEEPREPE